ncbi:hypothetical protein [Bradyrhizobium paxllaeri]|uniref:hypothetical protein n=1 Tax=Bradyrhizobium paxllaeri TaxID=190148 RepID=UPI0008105F48|nr:hypothetical protein [Bradyrhizobium paxllaeri]
MTEFDHIKALKEEITGLTEVRATLGKEERYAEEALGLAEAKMNALRKLRGFVDISIADKREQLRRLEQADDQSNETTSR